MVVGTGARALAGALLCAALLTSCVADRPNFGPAPSLAEGAAKAAPSSTAESGGNGGPMSVVIRVSRQGYLAATTTPGATCRAAAQLPGGFSVTDPRLLETHTADGGGNVAWGYTFNTSVRGNGTHTLSCSLLGQTRSASAPFLIIS